MMTKVKSPVFPAAPVPQHISQALIVGHLVLRHFSQMHILMFLSIHLSLPHSHSLSLCLSLSLSPSPSPSPSLSDTDTTMASSHIPPVSLSLFTSLFLSHSELWGNLDLE